MEFDAFLRLVIPSGTRAAYLENEDTQALFEILMLLDHLCIEEKIVQPWLADNISCVQSMLMIFPQKAPQARSHLL